MESMQRPDSRVYTYIDRQGRSEAVGDCILFGRYPKSRVTEPSLLESLRALAGGLPTCDRPEGWTSYRYDTFDGNAEDFMWYRDLWLEGTAYRGVYFTKYRPTDPGSGGEDSCQEENGYVPHTVYWFRYEPLRWRILAGRGDRAWLLAEDCLDAQPYRREVWDNSYVKSSVREWLNQALLQTAFNIAEREAICPALVTNRMEDEDVCDGDRPGSDTLDRIHLLSIEEAAEDLPREALSSCPTDYALCQGLRISPVSGGPFWWLRSPYYTISSWAQLVCAGCPSDFSTGDIGHTDTGIRPALWLKL